MYHLQKKKRRFVQFQELMLKTIKVTGHKRFLLFKKKNILITLIVCMNHFLA